MSFTPGVHPTARVHASASIDPTALIEAEVSIGRDVIVGPACVIGTGTRLRDRAIIVEHTVMGRNNDVHPYAVLGGDPQDLAFKGDPRGDVIIGDGNVFREGATVNRATQNGGPTRIGSNCFLMTCAHIGHNAQIGDRVIMANGASLAGHSRVGSRSVMSAHCAVHQFTHVGEGVMFQANASVSMHVPPYVLLATENTVVGLNVVGLKRHAEFDDEDRREIKEAFRAVYRRALGQPFSDVVNDLTGREWKPGARRFVDFVVDALNQTPPRDRGLCGSVRRARS
ncbi:MAG: acyl-ACP--UDP-N-acetylglucosamine O-acyltransferase [Phycisphaerales bacterium]|nr:acyl-ACP--UDP-N-acetylglucosamine O-acyltransferase [Phycisphaerales bacterium]